MCQLTFLHFPKSKTLTYEALVDSAVLNPYSDNFTLKHDDGFGYFINKNLLWKTKFPGFNINFSGIKGAIKPVPVISHVRKISRGKVAEENSHPFEFDNFIGAHNGTLVDDKFNYTKTDSEQFFERVEKLLEEKKELSLPEAIKEVYDSIEGGKFAFLLYDKRVDKFYIIRGLATLYKVKFYKDNTPVGIMINTEQKSLNLISQLITSKYGLETGKIELLDANSIYEYDENNLDIRKLKISIKQKEVVKHTATVYYGYTTAVPATNTNTNKGKKGKKYSFSILNPKGRTKLTMREVYAACIYSLLNNKTLNELQLDLLPKERKDPVVTWAKSFVFTEINSESYTEFLRKINQFMGGA